MAKFTGVNTTPATGSVAMYNFKEVAKTAGWKVMEASDGTTYVSYRPAGTTGVDQIVSGASGAGGLANSNAWYVLQDPGSRREYLIHHNSTAGTHTSWHVKFSELAKFTFGIQGVGDSFSFVAGTTYRLTDAAASFVAGDVGKTVRITGALSAANNGDFVITAQTGTTIDYVNAAGVAEAYTGNWYVTRTPTATLPSIASDEGQMLGTNAPTFGNLFITDNTYKHHVIFQSTPEGNVYPFWSGANTNASSVLNHCFYCEPMDSLYSSASDQSPLVTGASIAGWVFNSFSSGNVTSAMGWYKFGLTGATFGLFFGYYPASNANVALTGDLGSNPYDSNDNALPVIWGRNSVAGSNTGPKGMSKYMKFKWVSRYYPDSVNLATDAYAYFNDVLIPWPNGVAPIT